jgi:hypothetical protein
MAERDARELLHSQPQTQKLVAKLGTLVARRNAVQHSNARLEVHSLLHHHLVAVLHDHDGAHQAARGLRRHIGRQPPEPPPARLRLVALQQRRGPLCVDLRVTSHTHTLLPPPHAARHGTRRSMLQRAPGHNARATHTPRHNPQASAQRTCTMLGCESEPMMASSSAARVSTRRRCSSVSASTSGRAAVPAASGSSSPGVWKTCAGQPRDKGQS